MVKHRTPSGLARIRETLSALVASPDTPILDLVGGWRGVFDAVGPNVVFLVVYLLTDDLVMATSAALALAVLLVAARRIARRPVAPAVGGTILVALSGLMALMGGDGGDVFLPDLIQTTVFSAILFGSIVIRRPLVGLLLGPVVSGRTWRSSRVLLTGYDWATALMAAAAAVRTLSKLPFYFADDVVALGVVDLVTGVPLAILTTYAQIRVLRHHYAKARTRSEPALTPSPMLG